MADRMGSAGEMEDRARQLMDSAGDKVAEYTGRPLDSWTADVRGFVRDHPLQTIAIMIAFGYVIGKLMARG